jgi:hypothetical protein
MTTIDPKGVQPEALARFAESARNESGKNSGDKKNSGNKADRPGLKADRQTKPISTDPKLKQDAATKVLREGVFERNENSREAIDKLPDRIEKK